MGRKKYKQFNAQTILWISLGIFIFLFFLESLIPNIVPLLFLLVFLSWVTYLYYNYNINKSSKIIYYDMSKVDLMNEYDFEEFICDTYKKKGFKKAYTTPKSGDFGADIIVPDKQHTIAIQAKKYSPDVATGIDAIQEVLGAIHHYKATKGIVVTTSYFTNPAKILAAESNVELIDRDKLVKLLNTL